MTSQLKSPLNMLEVSLPMTIYRPEMNLGEARALYFAVNGFGQDGGDKDAWVEVRIGPLPLLFPNSEGRRRAVKFHDLHHILTGYPTTLRGETEIGAWEIATGIGRHYVGWLLDMLAFAGGLVINPRGVYHAFLRGRQSRNLFACEWDDRFLAHTVGEARRSLRLDETPRPATPRDKAAFAVWALISSLVYLLVMPLALLPVVALSLALRWTRKS
jgi:hypothetical protein